MGTSTDMASVITWVLFVTTHQRSTPPCTNNSMLTWLSTHDPNRTEAERERTLYHFVWSGSAPVWKAPESQRQRWNRSPGWCPGHRRRHRRSDGSRHSTFLWGRSKEATEAQQRSWVSLDAATTFLIFIICHAIIVKYIFSHMENFIYKPRSIGLL